GADLLPSLHAHAPRGVEPGVEGGPEAGELVQEGAAPVEGRGHRPDDHRHREEGDRARCEEDPEGEGEGAPHRGPSSIRAGTRTSEPRLARSPRRRTALPPGPSTLG